MPLIPFPDIPRVPGSPAIPRSPSSPTSESSGLSFLKGALFDIFQSAIAQRWGIYDQFGNALGTSNIFVDTLGTIVSDVVGLSVQSTSSISYIKETRISDFPIEQGSFASFNKAELPANPSVILAVGSNELVRAAFLKEIDAACKSTGLYNILTPEITYMNYSIEKYNYRRESMRGCTLLLVELYLKEIRQVSAQFSNNNNGQIQNPKDAGASPQINNGRVQTQTPPNQSVEKTLRTALTPAISLTVENSIKSTQINFESSTFDFFENFSLIQQINIQSTPSQTFQVTLDSQSVQINLYQKNQGLFVDIGLNGTIISSGIIAENLNYLMPFGYVGFLGNLMFVDTTGNNDPYWEDFGTRFYLIYFV